MKPVKHWIARSAQTTPYVHGDVTRITIGARVSAVNTVFNTASGEIRVGDDVIFGHNCMVLTGRHDFVDGMRKRLSRNEPDTPSTGSDIEIGNGSWIASGAIIIGGVRIGKHVIVSAGAVVTRDVPDHAIVAGIPARVIATTLGQAVSR